MKRALIWILLIGCTSKAPTDGMAPECGRLRQENTNLDRALKEAEQKLQMQSRYVADITKKFGELEDQLAKLEAEKNPPPVDEPAGDPLVFSSFPFEEETGSGRHQHQAIALGNVPVIVFRSKAGFSTVGKRAAAAVSALNSAAASGKLLTVSHHRVVAQTEKRSRDEILKVDPGDIIGLRRRSAGQVTRERVAAYWAAIINDYLDLVSAREPTRLALSGIESVRALQRELARASRPPGSPLSSHSLNAALDRLRAEERQALIELSMHVPARFGSSEEPNPSHDADN